MGGGYRLMLSENALLILNILEKQNGDPITAKKLSNQIGISERSIKSYMNEVSDFCEQSGCILIRKSGVGFSLQLTKEGEEAFIEEKNRYKDNISRESRINYILYILLTGWTTYTITLFADELQVSRNVISNDLNYIEPILTQFGLQLNRVTGKGIILLGDEFTKRKAFKRFCKNGISSGDVINSSDYRLSLQEETRIVSSYGKENLKNAVNIIKKIEQKNVFYYTDYSFQMIVEYLTIQIMRMRQRNYISVFPQFELNKIVLENITIQFLEVKNIFETECNIHISIEEEKYLMWILRSGDFQNRCIIDNKIENICENMIHYLKEVIGIELSETEELYQSLKQFIPSSFIRVKYGFEIKNPFFEDVKTIYPGIFSISYSLEWYYKKYIGTLPNEHELSFLSLFIGGAIKRSNYKIKIVLMSNCGFVITNIIAKRLEDKMKQIEIISILSTEEKSKLSLFEYDLVVYVGCCCDETIGEGIEYVEISSIVNQSDIDKITQSYFNRIRIKSSKEGNFFLSLFPKELMFYKKECLDREELISFLCKKMYDKGYVKKQYEEEVMKREMMCSTFIGNGIAIPHGSHQSILSSGIAVLKLEEPVFWGEDEVELVFLLAIHFQNIELTRKFFKIFTELVENKVEELKSCKTVEELEHILEVSF